MNISAEDTGLLVKSDVARRQLDAEVPPVAPVNGTGTAAGDASGGTEGTDTTGGGTSGGSGPEVTVPKSRRFHGTVQLDPTRVGRDASRIAEEVIAHLSGQPGAEVTVTIEIEATLPNGATDTIVRAVTENARTLKFQSQGFEEA